MKICPKSEKVCFKISPNKILDSINELTTSRKIQIPFSNGRINVCHTLGYKIQIGHESLVNSQQSSCL